MTLLLKLINKRDFVLKASKKRTFNRVHLEIQRMADRKVLEIKRKVKIANELARQAIDKKKLTELIAARHLTGAQEIIPARELFKRYETIWSSVLPVIQKSGEVAVQNMPKDIRARMAFDLVNPRTVQFVQNYKFNLIQGLTRNTIDGVRQAVLNGVQNGMPPKQIARQIVDLKGFGLTAKQINTADKYRKNLEASIIKDKLRREMDVTNLPSGSFNYSRDRGLLTAKDIDYIDDKLDRYQEFALANRADTIARTETIRSANAGQLETWNQARESDLIPANAKKVWIVTADDRLCPICEGIAASNPDGVGLSDAFDYDQSNPPTVSVLLAPPSHPNCRCAMGLTDDIGDVLESEDLDD